ncbi:MAG: hypothetical protein IJ920_04030 [Paludibacteraceae bacterium]|nr:hypothetical protein [Paludibacteraceae bacterium]MBR6066086.1 hypothetical protein [Paludibacteraceae bacterium]
MKKLFISLMAVLFSAYVVAADSAIARITITGTTSGGSAQITLIENPSYSAGYDNGYDAPCNINLAEDLPKTLHIYSYIGANKYSTIATNNLDGLHVDFITNLLDDEYTMTFEVFTLASGRTLDIYDLDENHRTDIDPSESYTFTATKGHNEIIDRFIINYVAPSYVTSVTTNAYGWATFSYDQDLVPVNATAQTLYKGAINSEYLDLDDVDYVKAGEGVIVYGAPSTTYYFAAGSGSDDFTGNALKATATYETSMKNVYVLKGNAFLEYVGTNTLAANKAYIQLPAGPNNAPARISMRFNEPQDEENAEAESVKAEKFVENGQVLIRRGNEVYNLQGQIIQ